MDCADRINVVATEQTLEPVRMLADRSSLSAVTVRVVSEGRRFDATIRKRWPGGSREPPVYRWELREVDESGSPKSGGLELGGDPSTDEACTDAEEAYWTAVEAMEAATTAPAGTHP